METQQGIEKLNFELRAIIECELLDFNWSNFCTI